MASYLWWKGLTRFRARAGGRRGYALHVHVPHPRGKGKRVGKDREPRFNHSVHNGGTQPRGCLLLRHRGCKRRIHRRQHGRCIPDPRHSGTPFPRAGCHYPGPSRDDPGGLGQGDPGDRASGPEVRLEHHAHVWREGRSAAVSEEDNKAVIRRWIEAYNNRDMQAEADVLDPGYVAHVPAAPGPLEGLEAWRKFTAPFVEAFPDLRLTVEDILSEGDKVAARVAFHGTHRGEFQGIAPTGKEVAFSSIEVNRVVGGKVEEHWVELDLLGLMQQLGAIPEPEHSEEASPT